MIGAFCECIETELVRNWLKGKFSESLNWIAVLNAIGGICFFASAAMKMHHEPGFWVAAVLGFGAASFLISSVVDLMLWFIGQVSSRKGTNRSVTRNPRLAERNMIS